MRKTTQRKKIRQRPRKRHRCINNKVQTTKQIRSKRWPLTCPYLISPSIVRYKNKNNNHHFFFFSFLLFVPHFYIQQNKRKTENRCLSKDKTIFHREKTKEKQKIKSRWMDGSLSMCWAEKYKKKRVGCGIYSHTTQQGDTQRTKLYYALYLFFFHLSYIPSQFCFLFFSVIFLLPCTPFILVAPLLFNRNFSI